MVLRNDMPAINSDLTDEIRTRRGFRHYYEEECDAEFEIRRPRGCGRLYEFLIEEKFLAGIGVLGLSLAGSTVLEVCGGSGMMAEKFARAGATVTSTDFSSSAVGRMRERARCYDFDLHTLTADAEQLPFADRSFDIVTVHDGLHHLEQPALAIREMARVAKRAVLIMDPANAALTRIAVKLGIAEDIEDAGNEVKRLIRMSWRRFSRVRFKDVRWRRMLMYYPHQPSGWFRWFDNPLTFTGFRAVFWCTNFACGRWGNKLAMTGTDDK